MDAANLRRYLLKLVNSHLNLFFSNNLVSNDSRLSKCTAFQLNAMKIDSQIKNVFRSTVNLP